MVTQRPSDFELTVAEGDITHRSATISWTVSTDPDGTAVTYSVFLDGTEKASGLNVRDLLIDGLEESSPYRVEVVAMDGQGETNRATASFSTNEAPISFSIGKVTLFDSQVVLGTVYSPLITIEDVVDFNTVSSVILKIADREYRIHSVENDGRILIPLTQAEYDVLATAGDKNGKLSFTDDRGKEQKEILFTYRVN